MRTQRHAVFASLPDAQFSPMAFIPDARPRRVNVDGLDYVIIDETANLLPFQKAALDDLRNETTFRP